MEEANPAASLPLRYRLSIPTSVVKNSSGTEDKGMRCYLRLEVGRRGYERL
jgi:hypothetical protein